jgi:hypothetical protein
MRDAARAEGEFYARAEALFGLWDMQVREGDVAPALVTARQLAVQFPANRGVANFIDRYGTDPRNGR